MKNNELKISVPGEWIIKKLMGPTLELVGNDLKKLYETGRNKIINAAEKKVKDLNDGARTNLRVTKDVFWNGSFSDEDICAEYFGGVLAASRSSDGKDDSGIYYLDLIKSLSSTQLKLHFIIYRMLNKKSSITPQLSGINVGYDAELVKLKFYFRSYELEFEGLKIDKNLDALYRKGILKDYRYEITNEGLHYTQITPTALGIQLFSLVYNRIDEWRSFTKVDFGDIEGLDFEINAGFSILEAFKKND